MEKLRELALRKLKERGVTVRDIAEIVVEIQKDYDPITVEECDDIVLSVIRKHESVHAILTGIALDEMAEKGLINNEISEMVTDDNGLYGVDEILALGIVNMYGSIALTNFGYLDKTKPGIVGKIDALGKQHIACHTFLDDLISAIAASAASRIAHSRENAE
jgi:phosphatidylglycerophosphatase A